MYLKRESTVPIMIGGANSIQFTLAVTVAMDETNLPLIVIFKRTPRDNVQKQLPDTLPDGFVGCMQKKGRMDDRTMRI